MIKQVKLQKNFFNHFIIDFKLGWKHQLVVSYLIVFIYFIKNVIRFKCFKCGGSFIDSPDWIKDKKAAMNPSIRKITSDFNTL